MWPEWYVGGKLNIVYSAVEKWAKNPKTAENEALIWESEDGQVLTYTFSSLSEAVSRAANGLQQEGLKRG